MKNKNYELDVLVNNKPVKQYGHEGESWIEAKEGTDYTIKVKNNTSRRILAIVSVDGLDTISGEPASKDSGGYIVNGYSSFEIKGFRSSLEKVNLFTFADKEESYAVTSPNGDQSSKNVGGISLLVFSEKIEATKKNLFKPFQPKPWDKYDKIPDWKPSKPHYDIICQATSLDSTIMRGFGNETARRINLDDAKAIDSLTPDLGTKFSHVEIEDKVTEIEFKRGTLQEQISLYYGSRDFLKKLGINFEPEPKVVLPTLFKEGNFCKPPVNNSPVWRKSL